MRMFELTRKNSNLFGRCDVNYQVGSDTGGYTGTPTVLWDRIVFNKAGRYVIGTTAESYKKTLYLKPNTTYTFSFTLSGYTSAYITVTSGNLTLWSSFVATSPITFTTKEVSVTTIMLLNNQSNTGGLTFSNLMLNEGSSALPYVSPIEDETIINDELFGFEGVYDTIESDGSVTKYWSRTTKTTDDSGNFTLSDYASGSNLIVVNNVTGETKILAASGTVATGWNNANVTVIYRLATPITGATFTGTVDLMPGENNIIVPKFGIISVKGKSKYLQG